MRRSLGDLQSEFPSGRQGPSRWSGGRYRVVEEESRFRVRMEYLSTQDLSAETIAQRSSDSGDVAGTELLVIVH